MRKISVVIAHVPGPELDKKLNRCIDSLDGYDELILVVNDGIGFGKAFNRGFQYARGDYIMAISNDTQLIQGTLEDLCSDKDTPAIMSPNVNGAEPRRFWACFFGMPREVYIKTGGFDESFGLAYFEDDDFIKRCDQLNIPMYYSGHAQVTHEGGQTVKTISTEDENMAIGRARFIEKWGQLP